MAENLDDSPPQPKKKRGPYKRYLDPGQPFIIPKSTLRSWELSKLTILPPQQTQLEDGTEQENNDAELAFVQHDEEIVDNISNPTEYVCVGDSNQGQGFILNEQQQQDHQSADRISTDVDAAETALETDHAACAGVCVCGNCNICTRATPHDTQQELASGEDSSSHPKFSYIEKYKLHESLLPSLPTTKFEALLMILHLCIRHSMTQAFIEDMLEFVNVILGEPVLRTSYYLFNQVFKPSTQMQFHYYCKSCHLYLGERANFDINVSCVECTVCGASCDVKSHNSENFFVLLSVKHQLEFILNRPDFKIIPHLNRRRDAIRDVMDGDLYQSYCTPGKPLANEHAISVMFNTDGAAVYKSNRGSLWPIQMYINEVSPEDRMKSENIILAGLWYGKSAPDMSCFLTPFLEELDGLHVNGVEHCMPDGSTIMRPVIALGCSVDSSAKPKILCMKQWNGIFGCGYCMHPNPKVPEDGNKHHYVTSEVYPCRTHDQVIENMVRADTLDRSGRLKKSKKQNEERDDSVNGVKGLSPLVTLTFFNIVWGFVIDYLHAIPEGIVAYLFEVLCSSENSKQPYYLDKCGKLAIVDTRLEKITPPQSGMTRRPRGLLERAKWKAKEWRAFILYYALPCLSDVLPVKYYDHLKLLVTAFFILLKDCITFQELNHVDELLQKFVRDFEINYGVKYVTYNLHLLTHLAQSVAMTGPLWATSNFPFESGNGRLLKLIQGTKGVVHEIGRKHVTVQSVSSYITDNAVKPNIVDFCSKVINFKYCIKKSEEFDGVKCLGGTVASKLTDEESLALTEFGDAVEDNQINYFRRVVYNKLLYYSRAYSKPKVFDDTCVLLSDNTYAVLQKIFSSPSSGKMLAFIRPIRIADSQFHLAPHIKCCAHNVYGALTVILFSNVAKKVILITVDNKHYICDVPNDYEKD